MTVDPGIPDDLIAVAGGDATERVGIPGHDAAKERATGVRLLTLRAQGLSYEAIALETGYSDASGARNALLRALDRHEVERADDLRAVENARYDASERALRMILARAGKPNGPKDADVIRAVDSLTRLSARRARLNGLDRPVQVEVSTGAAARVADALAQVTNVVQGMVVEPDRDDDQETDR